VLHAGPSNTADTVRERGSILHLWRSTYEPPDVAARQASGPQQAQEAAATSTSSSTDAKREQQQELHLPDSVSISYFTAPGCSLTQDGAASAAAAAGGLFQWDQQQLRARPTSFVFTPGAPQMSVSHTGSTQQASKAAAQDVQQSSDVQQVQTVRVVMLAAHN
jgi:hypothetical protein